MSIFSSVFSRWSGERLLGDEIWTLPASWTTSETEVLPLTSVLPTGAPSTATILREGTLRAPVLLAQELNTERTQASSRIADLASIGAASRDWTPFESNHLLLLARSRGTAEFEMWLMSRVAVCCICCDASTFGKDEHDLQLTEP